jgi:hypothetical protein
MLILNSIIYQSKVPLSQLLAHANPNLDKSVISSLSSVEDNDDLEFLSSTEATLIDDHLARKAHLNIKNNTFDDDLGVSDEGLDSVATAFLKLAEKTNPKKLEPIT